jgi:hypothetical protein
MMEYVPVNDSMLVKELESERNFGCVEPGSWLVKLPSSLYLEHEVPPIDVLHDEEEPVLGLETRVEGCEEGMGGGEGKDPLLRHRTVHVVILNYHIFLQYLSKGTMGLILMNPKSRI